MNAVKGALGLVIVEIMYWLIPPDHDPVFTALPVQMKMFCLLALVSLFFGGVVMFAWGVWDQYKKPQS